MEKQIVKYLSEIGSRGGKKSRRKLDSQTAKEMVRLREARRAYRKFHSQCFWSFEPEYKVTAADIPWVAEQLMKNGNRAQWLLGAKLCP